jgi:hypothetical protein
VCECGKCPAVVDGYVCIGPSAHDKQAEGAYSHRKHGQCEIFTDRNEYRLDLKKDKEEQ